MQLLTIFVAVIATISAIPVDEKISQQWAEFKSKYNKIYQFEDEELLRKDIFASNLEKIQEHNELYKKGLTSYKMGINKFADLSLEEFNKIYNRYKKSNHGISNNINKLIYQSREEPLPDTIDWRDSGAVTPVKDQGGCGSCWAFSTTGSLEGQVFLQTNQLISISEQNLVDCAKNGNNAGCNGGYQEPSFQYIIDNDGIDTEESYPYEGVDGECRYDPANKATSISSYTEIIVGDETDLQNAVALIGPVAVSIDAGHSGFQLYDEGVYYEENCLQGYDDVDELNHAVLAVGYGNEDGQDYWLVKNSWGEFWGIDGYIKMSRNRDNNCGIASDASYPTI